MFSSNAIRGARVAGSELRPLMISHVWLVVHRYTRFRPRVGRQTGPTASGTELGSHLGGRAKGNVGFGVEDVVVDHDMDVYGDSFIGWL